MSKLSTRDREAFATLDALYARLPSIVCQRKCGIACGAVPVTDLEARRVQLAAHVKPRTIPVTVVPPGEVASRTIERCIYLRGEAACTVYAVRPLICRVWGLTKMLSCMHGCVPSRWVSDLEFLDLARAVERLGGGRVLRTTPTGLSTDPMESYESIAATIAMATASGERTKTAAALDADAEHTRSLRAIFGGRIIRAMTNEGGQR